MFKFEINFQTVYTSYILKQQLLKKTEPSVLFIIDDASLLDNASHLKSTPKSNVTFSIFSFTPVVFEANKADIFHLVDMAVLE